MVNDCCSEIMIIDLECGVGVGGGGLHHHHTSDQSFYYSQDDDDNDIENDNEEDEEVGSCYSQFYNSNDNEEEDDNEIEIGRLSSSSSDCSVQLNDNDKKMKNVVVSILLDDISRDCRICQLSLVDSDEQQEEDDELIELGCCCKDDLALAHQHCADTWFKIKGNKICEICNSIASNLVVANETPSTTQGIMDVNPAATSVATTHMSTATRGRGCINGHRILNFILACLVFAFVISWLFHFNIPS